MCRLKTCAFHQNLILIRVYAQTSIPQKPRSIIPLRVKHSLALLQQLCVSNPHIYCTSETRPFWPHRYHNSQSIPLLPWEYCYWATVLLLGYCEIHKISCMHPFAWYIFEISFTQSFRLAFGYCCQQFDNCIVLCCITLYYTVLQCIVLHCTALH